ncbi:hypothetical protein BH09ACT8_BH09ACT8_18370 [soil metagenome]
MQGAIRSCLTAGIALVGVGVITVAPVAPQLPEIQVSSMPTPSGANGGSSADPAGAWLRVFEHGGIEDLSQLGASVVADSASGLRQLIATQFDYSPILAYRSVAAAQDFAAVGLPAEFQPVMEALAQGDVVAASNALNNIALVTTLAPTEVILDVLQIPIQITDKLTNVVRAVISVNTLLTLTLGAIGPVQAVINAATDTGQAVFDGITGGNTDAAITALVAAPAAIVGAYLNGYTDDRGFHYPGIFTVDNENPQTGGLFQTLFVTLPRTILTALGFVPDATTDGAVTARESAVAAPELDAPSLKATPGLKEASVATGNAAHPKRMGSTSKVPVTVEAAPVGDAPGDTTTTVGDGKRASEVKGGNKIANQPKRPSATIRATYGASSGSTKATAGRGSKSPTGD